jgi:hypothetical protein
LEQYAYLDSRRVLWASALTVLVSVIAVLAVRELAIRILHPAPAFLPLALDPPILDTFIGCVGAIFVFVNIAQYRNPVRTYRRVAAVVLVLSF